MNWETMIGRSASQSDCLTPAALARFRATLDQPTASAADDQLAPQGIHWCLCLPDAPTALLGPDGHPLRDETPDSFMPPIPLPRRMWAASEMQFHAPIRSGAQIRRVSTIASIKEKNGASGPLVFVEVAHENFADDQLAIQEKQTIVYREAAPATAPSSANDRPAPVVADTLDLTDWQWHREIQPSAPLLFRYSALTFNSHRIHYDLPYARDEEGYAGLVVHGPLTATLLLDLAQRQLGLNSLKRFQMRAQSPAFVDQPIHLVGREDGAGGWTLAALGPDGRTIVAASAA